VRDELSAMGWLSLPFKFISSVAASKTRASIRSSAFLAAVTDSHPRSASMSSIIMHTSISCSTTRTRRPESNLSIKSICLCGKGHRTDQAVRPVVEINRAFRFMVQTALDQPRAKSLV